MRPMPPRDLHYLYDMLVSAKIAESYLSQHSWSHFLEDIQLQDAAIRRLEIIGEAERRLSEGTRISLSKIPLILMRNQIVKEYDKIDLEVVWNTVQNDLPKLIAEIEKVMPEEKLQEAF
ncbi:DUF86 domain-containing protein [Oxynema sp. CENA135]|uniref:HepT-like ribonuclease domain-containing protein n=1 Tax=Oxynema sp. CENA135 TaxID=984206 RepID=UPI001F2A572D|nr:HepT-like ribonuclease domain-containing protein [Oxynema sp. CENA135]